MSMSPESYAFDRSESAQLYDLLELAGSPEAVQASVLAIEVATGRRPTLAEVVAEILRSQREAQVEEETLTGV